MSTRAAGRNVRLPSRQLGVTIVEILVTVIIISVGLLGVAALHLSSLRAGQGAHTRSQATAFAVDIIDRMRANPTDAASYIMTMAATPPVTPTGLVDKDKKQWLEALAAALPNGDGAIRQRVIATRTMYEITIQWDERRKEDDNSPPNSFVTTVEL